MLPLARGCVGAVILASPIRKPLDFEAYVAAGALPLISSLYRNPPDSSGIRDYLKLLTWPMKGEIPSFLYHDFQRTDPEIHTAITSSIQSGCYSDEIDLVWKSSLPVAFMIGEKDQIASPRYLQDVDIHSTAVSINRIPEGGHLIPWALDTCFNQLLLDFIKKATTSACKAQNAG